MALGLLALLASPLAVRAAVVYKWTDADGVIHFSDQPVPGAERIVTTSGAGSSSHGGAVQSSSSGAPPAKPKSAEAALEFNQFAIASPTNEETITGSGSVAVRLDLDPGLKPMQAITWYLNGSPLANQASDATQFTLDDLPRGTYTLGATVLDQASGETKSAEAVTFYVVRPSVLSPQHK
jgi:uncharacterized protein DUF4124